MKRTLLLFALSMPMVLFAQSVGINSEDLKPDESAILDISSSKKGLLIPRMRTVDRLAIANPAQGLTVYDRNTLSYWVYQGALEGGWTEMVNSKNNLWSSTGADIYNTNLVGKVGIGIANPAEMLHLFNADGPARIRVRSDYAAGSGLTAGIQLASIGGTSDLSRGNATVGGTTAGISNVNLTRLWASGGPILIGNSNNNPIHFATNEIVRATLSGNGRLGIGTSDPSGLLSLNSNFSSPNINFSTEDTLRGTIYMSSGSLKDLVLSTAPGNETGRVRMSAGGTQFKISPLGTVTIGPSGMVGPYTFLISDSDKDPMIQFQKGATDKGFVQIVNNDIKIGTNVDNDLGSFFVRTNGADRLKVDQNGNVGVGTSSPAVRFQVGVNGDGTVARANSWTTFSDERFKKDIVLIENALDKVAHVGGYYYNWKNGGDQSRQAGLLAQEVEQVLPEIVNTDEKGYKSVDYGKMNALLLQAIKEQQKQIEALEAKIAGMEKAAK
jgi:hypothetical protein